MERSESARLGSGFCSGFSAPKRSISRRLPLEQGPPSISVEDLADQAKGPLQETSKLQYLEHHPEAPLSMPEEPRDISDQASRF
ncbi:hypothetical protein E2320_005668 [Naja naja]|nr:hypothetical protein E2320_005668 [Naja naja]